MNLPICLFQRNQHGPVHTHHIPQCLFQELGEQQGLILLRSGSAQQPFVAACRGSVRQQPMELRAGVRECQD